MEAPAFSITGAGFDSVIAVTFGGIPATIHRLSSTAIDVTTTASHAGVVEVIVSTRDGHSVTSPDDFTFI